MLYPAGSIVDQKCICLNCGDRSHCYNVIMFILPEDLFFITHTYAWQGYNLHVPFIGFLRVYYNGSCNFDINEA